MVRAEGTMETMKNLRQATFGHVRFWKIVMYVMWGSLAGLIVLSVVVAN